MIIFFPSFSQVKDWLGFLPATRKVKNKTKRGEKVFRFFSFLRKCNGGSKKNQKRSAHPDSNQEPTDAQIT